MLFWLQLVVFDKVFSVYGGRGDDVGRFECCFEIFCYSYFWQFSCYCFSICVGVILDGELSFRKGCRIGCMKVMCDDVCVKDQDFFVIWLCQLMCV